LVRSANRCEILSVQPSVHLALHEILVQLLQFLILSPLRLELLPHFIKLSQHCLTFLVETEVCAFEDGVLLLWGEGGLAEGVPMLPDVGAAV